jgi:amino acid adenylation domain-containing protein
MNIMAVFNVLLYKYTTQDDIVVGSAVAGRPHADLQRVIGMFVNMLPIRNYPKGDKQFIDFAREVREHSLKAFENQDVQFEELIDNLDLDRDPSRNPLFDVSLVAQNFTGGEWSQSAGTGVGEEIATSKFDMTLFITETADQVRLSLEYYKGIFKIETIDRFAGHLVNLLHQVVENPFVRISDLNIIGEEERQRIIYDFNSIETGYTGNKTLHESFEEQAARTPGHTAVVGVEQLQITYSELNEKSNQLAYMLREKGVQPDTIVGLMVERSIEMIIGILGILKAGGAYLPIDPDYPEERIDYLLTDSNAMILLKKSEIRISKSETNPNDQNSNDQNKINGCPSLGLSNFEFRASDLSPSNLAYVIYTSGTTGKPKGTLTTHQNAVRVVKDTNYIELKETDRILQLSNYAFDGSVFDIYGALLNGAALVLVGKEEVFDVDKLSRLIERESITLFFVTTALFNTLVDLDIGCLKNVRKILFGGERVSVEHTCKALEFLGKDRIMHMYGPTETTVYASYYNIDSTGEGAVTIPIGGPISNTALYVLDENMTPQPVGLTGEIYIGGEGVARGYLNNPELTAEKFDHDLWDFQDYQDEEKNKKFLRGVQGGSFYKKSPPGRRRQRIYKTGDLGRWLADGSIEFIGRTDSQVKIRGFRIEPGEVESQLLKHDEIKEAVIVVKEDERRDKYLCAYYVPVEEATSDNPGSAELKEFLSHTLPNYMIPTHFVMVGKMPLNPNGKVDIKALPGPTAMSDVQYAAPASAVEKKLVEIWSEVLGPDRVGIDDNFFQLGGQSIKATILAAKIHQTFNVKVPLAEIFRNPTVRGLASFLEEAEQEMFTILEPAEEKEFYELSYNQKRLWILNQLDPESSFYNMPEVTSINRGIDVKIVKETLNRLVERHESLRTAFKEINGQVHQVIEEKLDIGFEIFDISTLEVEEKQEKRARLFRDTARAPFDLSTAPLFRLALIKLAQEQYDLVFNMHHIITDGWSMNILKTEFSLLYESCRAGKKVELKPLILQYRDFTEWTNKQLNDTGLKKDSHRFWKERLEQGTPTLELQRDFKGNREDRRGAGYRLMINRETKDRLKKLSRDYSTSLFMVMFSVYIVLMARFSGLAHREEIACSIISSGREHLSLQNIIGFFVSSLIFKTYVDYEENFIDFLRRLHAEVMEIFQHQDYPVELVCDDLGMRYPEIPVSFNFINLRDETGGVDMATFDSYQLADFNDVKFDIEPYIKEYKNGIDIFLSYRENMFNPGTIAYMMKEYTKMLEFFSSNPGKSFNDYKITKRKKEYRYMIIRAFEEQVEKTPDKLAVKGERESITYRELNRYANCIAYGIKNAWPGGGNSEIETVGLLLDHGPRMIAAILGTLKAGKVYVPLTPDYPDKRIFYILTHSRAGLIITDAGHEKRIKNMVLENNIDIRILNLDTMKEDVFVKNSNREINGNKIAYIMYTSGSTGKPKGVLQTHESVVYFTRKWTGTFSITSSDRLTHVSSFCHDMSLQDMFGALHNGAVLYPYDMKSREENAELSEFLIKERITIWHSVPSLYSYFANTLTGAEQFRDLRFILLGGEPVRKHEVEVCKRFFPCSMLAVVYGQTESSFNSVQVVSPRDSFEKSIIGKSLEETEIFVIDEEGNEVDPLETGEIIVAGRYISPGYWRAEETTREVIREDPDFGRLYRTGDLGCLLLDGSIEFMGRKDWQVKIRGYRVELGEIESVLLQHDEIREAAAAAIGGGGQGPGDKYIAAYYVSGRAFEPWELREYLGRYLPDYMIPTYFVRLDALPLTASGKIHRRALPPPTAAAERQYTAPRDEIEEKLVGIWAEVLKQSSSSIGIDDSFFDLGGHSLKAVLMSANIHKELNVRIPFSKIFARPDIRRLAEYIKGAPEEKYASVEPVEQKEYYPSLSSAQKRMFVLQQMDITSTGYNMPVMIPVEGGIDKKRLEDTFRKLIHRHEAFRTSFAMINGQPVQRIHHHVEFEMSL